MPESGAALGFTSRAAFSAFQLAIVSLASFVFGPSC